MNKTLASAIALLTLLSAGVASAQTYYPNTSTGCVTLSRDLYLGSRNSEVRSLQSFLIAQNYPGSGSWMLTGYFGAATQAAVRIFQGQHGLAQTGFVDASTRAAIATCGSVYNNNYNNNSNFNYNSYPYNYTTPYTNTYPYNYNYSNTYPYTSGVTVGSLSVTSAVTGASVTVSGTGFDPNNNTVYVGSVPVTGLPSYNGNALTFVVPQNVSGSVMVYVANARGTSNSVTLNVINYNGVNGCVYPYTSGYGSCGCNTYGYGTNCPNTQLTISSLSPNSGAVGSTVTIYGTGFSTSGNTVHFGGGIITNIGSNDGRAISFTVPVQLVGYNNQVVALGVYPVSVTNSAGYTSSTLPYTVTALGGASAPSISNVAGPTNLSVGVAGTWTISVLAGNSSYTSVAVRWGDEGTYGYAAAAPQTTYLSGSQTFSFTHTYAQSGNYTATFTVTNLSGQSSIATASVVVSGSGSGQVTLSSLSPVSGRVGSQVILQGSGFTTYDNTVRFGAGGTQHLVSQNGTQLYFTIPSYISACDVMPGTQCFAAQQVVPGTYQVYVTNALGQTNQQTFTVTP